MDKPYYFKCPKCENNKIFFKVPKASRSENKGCLIFVGNILLGGLLWRFIKERVQCGDCGLIFRRPRFPSSPVVEVLLWLIFISSSSILVGFFAEGIPEFFTDISGRYYLEQFIIFVEKNIFGVSVGLAFFLILFFVFTVYISTITNLRYIWKFKMRYKHKPKDFNPKTNIPEVLQETKKPNHAAAPDTQTAARL